jgi:hypothetical protein
MTDVEELRSRVIRLLPEDRAARTFATAVLDNLILAVRLECAHEATGVASDGLEDPGLWRAMLGSSVEWGRA